MADETKRVIDQTTDTSLAAGDFIIVDNQSEGTRKFDLGTELTDIKKDLGDLPFIDVTSVSDMTDNTKIYRYSGTLYFYDGSAWVEIGTGSGGSDIEIYVDGTSLVINTALVDGNEVSY